MRKRKKPTRWAHINAEFVPLIIFFILFILSIISSDFRTIAHAFIGQFTTGNSSSKTIILFFLISLLLAYKISKKTKKKTIKPFIFSLIFLFGASLLSHFLLFSTLNLEVDDYLAHASAQKPAWEGTYLQHIHSSKIPVYFIEQFVPLPLPAHDNGEPLYEIFPLAPLFSLLLLFSWIIYLYSSVEYVSSHKHPILASIACALLFIAGVDGGLFSSVSATAFSVFFSLYFLDKNLPFKWLYALSIPTFILSFPIFFLNSPLIFRDWLFPVLFVISSFACFETFKTKKFFLWVFILLISSFFIVSTSFDRLFGKNHNSFYLYGLPDMSDDEIVSLFNANASTLTHYGWYASFNTLTIHNTREMEAKVNSPTYLYAVPIWKRPKSERKVVIYPLNATGEEDWESLIENSTHFSVQEIDYDSAIIVHGISDLSGPDLSLMCVSLLKSRGIDAIVVSKVI